jgi:predicted PurR-regulated permease PerM
MHWLYLLASIACLALAMVRTMPTLGVLVFLAGALGFMVAWVLGWLSSRISSQSRDISHILGPEELKLMREQAEARKRAQEARENQD